LMMAAEGDHVEMVKLLLSYGAEPNLISRTSGDSALHKACRAGSSRSVRALLQGGAFVNLQRPTTGETPLHEALKHGFPECAGILIEGGAKNDTAAFDQGGARV
jgi:ankyrin repeat protein